MKVTPPEGPPVVKVGATGVGGAREVPTADEIPIAGGYFGTGTVEDALAAIATLLGAIQGTTTTTYWPMLALTSGPTAGTLTGYVTTTAGGGEVLSTVAASGATETIDLATANVHDITLTANCVFTFAAVSSGRARSFTLLLRQDATGSRLATWPASVVWPGGTTPTLSTAASSVDVFAFFTLDGGVVWYGFPTGSSASAITVKDEGVSLATAATSLDFVGAGVVASGAGAAKTITISGSSIVYEPLTSGANSAPELVFDAAGRCVMVPT